MFGLDYSYARPGSAALLTAGITSVGRYLGTDGRCINIAELTDYLNHGISVWFIKENAANGMLGGSVQGIRDATAAQTQLNALGQPNAVVYYTADFDAQPAQFGALDAYLQGVATVMPVSRIGIYAGIDYINHAANLASYYWKTASTSFDHGKTANMQLHLIQTLNAVPIPNTDYDIIVQANHGQTGTTGTAPAPAPTPAVTTAPQYPLPAGSYFGPKEGPATSVSGYYSHRNDLAQWQTQMAKRGWSIAADGLYGPQTANITRTFQTQKNLTVDGLIGPQTWGAAWTAPIT